MDPSYRPLAVPLGALVLALIGVGLFSWGSGAGSAPNGQTTSPPSTQAEVVATDPEPTPTTTTTTTTTVIDEGPVDTVVSPEDDLEALVSTSPPGTTFVLVSGVHRGRALIPKDGQSFEGQPGAVLSGAVLLTGFEQRGELWVVSGQQAQGRVHGQCDQDSPRCSYPEDLFVDDQALVHVESLSAVVPGTWFFDYEQDTVYMGESPDGRVVELSVVPYAFRGEADDVTIRNLVIEKYAVPAQQGAIDSRRDNDDLVGGSGWIIANNVVRWNHGVGIAATTEAVVEANLVYENGQLGLSAKGADVTLVGNEVYGNNTAGFSVGWEAGGTKFAYTQGLVVSGNYVHDNDGVGLWTDIDNVNTTYQDNRVIDNAHMGILHEISYDATITGNEVRGNGFGFDAWIWGAGIVVSTSVNVEVYDNVVEGNADGIVGVDQDRSDAPASYGPLSLENLAVHDNVVAGNGGWSGVAQDRGDNAAFTSQNNRFFDNTYTQEGLHWFWLNDERTFEEWLGFGQS